MRIPAATTAALFLSVSTVALVLTSADAKTKTGGVLGASYHRGAKRHAFARRSLQPKETDGVELIYPKPLFQPRKHGKTTGDRDENGLLLGHGYMDDLDPRGATGAEPKPLKSHKGTIESNQVVKQDGANGDADTPPTIKTPKSKGTDAVGEAAKQDDVDTPPTIKTPKSKGTDAVSEAVKQDAVDSPTTMKTSKSAKGADATGEAVKQDVNGDIPTNMTPKSKSAKGAMTAGTDADVDADDTDDTDVREEVVCVPRPGARGPDGMRSDSIGASNKMPKTAKTAKTAKSSKMPKAGKNTRRGMRRLSPKGPNVGKVSSTIDSDCDGLTDAEELELGTDPYDADSDGDGVSLVRPFINLLWYESEVLGQNNV